jgi:hypothetical protein
MASGQRIATSTKPLAAGPTPTLDGMLARIGAGVSLFIGGVAPGKPASAARSHMLLLMQTSVNAQRSAYPWMKFCTFIFPLRIFSFQQRAVAKTAITTGAGRV